jgi:soluble lytic murein transglycosylase-like protein/outer membrane protein assembly factor BamD (BamD/ComL family)
MLEFRPHHFLCTLGFEGKGYSDAFVQSFAKIADSLRRVPEAGDHIEILVVEAADSICQPCPNRQGQGCASEDKISKLDREHAAILGLKPGDRITWGQAKKLLAEKMTMAAFDRACAPCSWKSMGVCEAALKRLKGSDKKERVLGAILGLFLGLSWSSSAQAVIKLEPVLQPVDVLQEKLHLLKTASKHHAKKSKKRKPSHTPENIKKAYELIEDGKTKEAAAIFGSIERDSLFGDYGYWLSAQASLKNGQASLQAKKYTEALHSAESSIRGSLKIVEDYPYSPFVKTVQKDIAAAEQIKGAVACERKRWALCAEYFESAFQRYTLNGSNGGNGELTAVGPRYLQAYSQACSNAPSENCEAWLSKLATLFPKVSQEFRATTKFYSGLAEKPKLPGAVARSTKSYRAPDSDQVAFDAALSDYFDKKYSGAAQAFQRLLDDYPRSAYRYRAQYWLSRALEKEKKNSESQKIMGTLASDSPLTYYGLLAAISRGDDIGSHIEATVPMGTSRDPGLSAVELHRLTRAELLLEQKAAQLAALELKDFKAREAHSNPFLVYMTMLQSEAGNHSVAFSILNELIQRGHQGVYSSYLLRFVFPVTYMGAIKSAAGEFSVDPVLLLSLIKQESSFDPTAVSSSGAQGLTQLMPVTALDMSPGILRSDLQDVRVNVRTGAKYLGKMLSRFNGNIVLALAAYNAGPGAVDRWFKASQQRSEMMEFIESIPYRETREYVSAIIRNYIWYSRLMNQTDPSAEQTEEGTKEDADSEVKPTKLTEVTPKKKETVSLDYFWNPYKPGEKQAKAD